MKNSDYLLNRVFLLALFFLLLNDFFLKAVSPSFLSGKLSDLWGIIVFVFFFTFLFGNRLKTVIFLSTALLFCWWKSALSTGFIDSWNQLFGFYPIQRTIDYTDLFCLVILVPAYFYKPVKIGCMHQQMVVPVLLLGAFAIAATSKAKNPGVYSNTRTYNLQESFKIKEVSFMEFLEYLSLSNLKAEKNTNAAPPEKPGDYHYYTLYNFEIADSFIIETMHIAVREKNGNLKLLIQDVTLFEPPEQTDKEVKEELLELFYDFFAIGE
ncbi:hypothetical protein [Fluviicola chungangensis]|uniref:Uncharacterized protein n=1 Tax=Fluviicola chungangensis TaxID=2597671 RepID=A0A556N7B9_9FLAO|nr:hypothetical protein [Fluviicola chungangensis]TSJ48020.1 hypothetical protein FO442_02500 [Fluviicola chungangensis]